LTIIIATLIILFSVLVILDIANRTNYILDQKIGEIQTFHETEIYNETMN